MTLVAALGGLGGLAALLRSRGQNRVDERTQLTQEQVEFRQSMASQLAELRTQATDAMKRNDVLEGEGRELSRLVAGLTAKNEYQEKQIDTQAKQITALSTQNTQQASQIATLLEEKANYAQRVQVAEATVELLKRENAHLRKELDQLKGSRTERTRSGDAKD